MFSENFLNKSPKIWTISNVCTVSISNRLFAKNIPRIKTIGMMNKIILSCSIALISTSCMANNHDNTIDRGKICEDLSKKEGKEYSYQEGMLTIYGEIPPPAGSPIRREFPSPYAAYFVTDEGRKIESRIPRHWLDSSVELNLLKLAPLPIAMEVGKRYGFCYEPSKYNNYMVINHPEYIRLVKE